MMEHTVGNEIGRPIVNGHDDAASMRAFGFWVYLMSDIILFASLFAAFAVLSRSYAGGPTGREIFRLPGVLVETICLLLSSFTCGLAMLARNRGRRGEVIGWLVVTFLLGASFVGLEVREFSILIMEGNGPGRSAFLSAFCTLVGTHGLHVTCGLIWMAVLTLQIAGRGLDGAAGTRMMTLSMFWHFLDIVWICVFTFVYLLGSMA